MGWRGLCSPGLHCACAFAIARRATLICESTRDRKAGGSAKGLTRSSRTRIKSSSAMINSFSFCMVNPHKKSAAPLQRLSGKAPFNCSPCGAAPLESAAPWGVAAMPRRAIRYWRGYALSAGQARPRERRKNKGIPFLFAFRGGVTFLGAAARKRVFDTFPYFIPTPAFPTHRCFGEGNPEFPFSGREIGLFVSRHSLLIDAFAPCRKSLI